MMIFYGKPLNNQRVWLAWRTGKLMSFHHNSRFLQAMMLGMWHSCALRARSGRRGEKRKGSVVVMKSKRLITCSLFTRFLDSLYTSHFREMSGELWSTFGVCHMIDIFPELMEGESREKLGIERFDTSGFPVNFPLNPGTDDDSW